MTVVQQMMIVAVRVAHLAEELRRVPQIQRRVPDFLVGQPLGCGLVVKVALGHAVGLVESRHAGLHADRLVAHLDVAPDGFDRFAVIAAVGVTVDHHPVTASAAEQLIDRHAGALALDVPQRHVDCGNCRHRHRPAAPVSAAIQVLPDILDGARIAPDQARNHVLVEVGFHGQLAAVERGVAHAVDAVARHDLERDEVAAGTGEDGIRALDFHFDLPWFATACIAALIASGSPR